MKNVCHLRVFVNNNIILNRTPATFFLNTGPAAAIYHEWNATPELLTSLANTPSDFNLFTNFVIESGGPEIVTPSSLLWQATAMSDGTRALASSQDRP